MSRLRVEGVAVALGGQPVLQDVSFEVAEGAFAVIVGPSGCGKSTLLRAVAGLVRPVAGRIELDGTVLSDEGSYLPAERRRVGWVPQAASLFPHLTVAENVVFGRGRSSSRRRGADDGPTRELLELTGLAPFARRYPDELSGGQAQRVALARALAAEPRLLLLDEPFAALDPRLRGELREELRGMLETLGVTGVLVTHDQAEALELADTVVIMRDGSVEQQGTPAEVYREPATEWAATFLGEVVLLEGSATGSHAETALGRLAISSERSGPATVMLRPEQLVLSTDGGVLAYVDRVRYGGHDALIELALADGRVMLARVHAGEIPTVGDRVGVRVRGAGVAYPNA